MSHFLSFFFFLVLSGFGSYVPKQSGSWVISLSVVFVAFFFLPFLISFCVLRNTRVNKVNLDHLGRRDFLEPQ